MEYTMSCRLERGRLRLLLKQESEELLEACLPLPQHPLSDKPLKALLEALASWFETNLQVVFCAAELSDGFFLELTDERGIGLRTPYYEVSAVEAERLPARLTCADCHDVRQLHLVMHRPRGKR
jgi:hypothetical protein